MNYTTEALARAANLAYIARQAARQAARIAIQVRNSHMPPGGPDEREAARLARFAHIRALGADKAARWALQFAN